MLQASKKRQLWIFLMSVLVGTGGILYGYDIGVISGALLFIHQVIPMSDTQTGLIVGAVLLGGWFGSLIAGSLADHFGRRLSIIVASLLFISGIFCIISAKNFYMLLLARVLLGLGVGVVSVAVPLYVAELVPAHLRGRYVTFFQLFLTFGVVLAYFVDLAFTPTGNWHAMFEVVLIPAGILLIGSIILPESPRWLIAHHRHDEARKVLLRTHNKYDVEAEVLSIHHSMQQQIFGMMQLLDSKVRPILFLAIVIAVLNQWTGVNSFLQYAPKLLKESGVSSNEVAMISSVGIGMLNFVMTLLALFLVDKVGRKHLLIIGTIGIFISEVFLGFIQHLSLSPITLGHLTLFGLFGFIIFFAIGPGVVVWLALSELFPTHVRGSGMALCLFFNAMAGWLLATFFLDINRLLGMGGSYYLCSFFTFLYILVAVFLLPETGGKTLEQIQNDVMR